MPCALSPMKEDFGSHHCGCQSERRGPRRKRRSEGITDEDAESAKQLELPMSSEFQMQCTGVGKLTSPNYSSLASKWKKKDELKLAERYTASPDFGRSVQSQVIPVPNNKIT